MTAQQVGHFFTLTDKVFLPLVSCLIASFLGASVIGHGDPIIAKRRDLLKYPIAGVRRSQTGTTRIFRIFSKILQMVDPNRWLTRHDTILESQVGYPPHQPEKIQKTFDRNL